MSHPKTFRSGSGVRHSRHVYRSLSTRKAFYNIIHKISELQQIQTVQAQSQSQIKYLNQYWPKHGLTDKFTGVHPKCSMFLKIYVKHNLVYRNKKEINVFVFKQPPDPL